HSWVEAYFPGNGWIVFDPTPDAPMVKASIYSRLSQLADWADLTWNDWVISYDFAHQTALAQTLQTKSRNWRELGSAWFAEKQRRMKNGLSLWQIHHAGFSFVLPLFLMALLLAFRYGWIGGLLRRLRMALTLRGRNSSTVSPQIASRLYAEMLRL